MSDAQDESSVPSVRFKRRKIANSKRVHVENGPPEVTSLAASATTRDALSPPKEASQEEEESAPNLKEILRNRRRPRDRTKEVAHRAEAPRTELMLVDGHAPAQYPSRFIAQTGQVVDRDDKQM